MFVPPVFLYRGGPTLISAITTASLTANLQICLDAGDPLSWTGTGKWQDRSGNGYDFNLGDGSTGTTFPTFNGSVGSTTGNWSFDGGDYFTYDTTNEAWMETLHKNNAVFSMVCFFYQGASTSESYVFATNTTSGTIGLQYITSNGSQVLYVTNGSGTVLQVQTDGAVSANGWHMIGVSLTEATGAGGGFFYLDGAYAQVAAANTFTSTYASPSSSSASLTAALAALGGGTAAANAADIKLSSQAAWTSALSKANMDTLWTAMRGRFGI